MKRRYTIKNYVRETKKGSPHKFVRQLTEEQEKEYKELWRGIKPFKHDKWNVSKLQNE